jgi:hypothetical protein
VSEDLLNHYRILDARDDSQRPAAGRAGLDIDAKGPFQASALRTSAVLDALPLTARSGSIVLKNSLKVISCRILGV